MRISSEDLELCLAPVAKANDEGWARITIDARVPGFTVHYTGWLRLPGAESFESRLREMQDGIGNEHEAVLDSVDEPGLLLELKMNRHGHIAGLYRFISERRDGEPTALSGSFDMDQSFLPSMISEISGLISDLKSA